MKTAPTDIDREAARLFTPAPGMRVILDDRLYGGLWARVSVAKPGRMSGCYETGTSTWAACCDALMRLAALDTDDPATVGVMLAQVAAARPNQAVSVVDRLHTLPGETERRFMVLVEHDNTQTTATGPTLGVALVAAMKEVRK